MSYTLGYTDIPWFGAWRSAGAPLFAQVTPGNAASLRAFPATGIRPTGAEVLFLRDTAR